MANKNTANKPLSRAKRVRILLKEGRSIQEIAATVGVTLQYIYNIRYQQKVKGERESARISPLTGKPVRKYTRRKTTLVEKTKAVEPTIRYIEIPVQQPHYDLSWGQRLKAFFTGRI